MSGSYWYCEEDGEVYDDIRDILEKEVTDEEWQEYRDNNGCDWCDSKEAYIEDNVSNRDWDEWGPWSIRPVADDDRFRAYWLQQDIEYALRSGKTFSIIGPDGEMMHCRPGRHVEMYGDICASVNDAYVFVSRWGGEATVHAENSEKGRRFALTLRLDPLTVRVVLDDDGLPTMDDILEMAEKEESE